MGKVLGILLGPATTTFQTPLFRGQLAEPLRGGLRASSGWSGIAFFSQTLQGPRGLRSDLASLLGEARTSGIFLF